MPRIATIRRLLALVTATIAMAATPLAAQSIERVDPNQAIDGDLQENPGEPPVYGDPSTQPATGQDTAPPAQEQGGVSAWSDLSPESDSATTGTYADQGQSGYDQGTAPAYTAIPTETAPPGTWQDDDLIGAAQGFFGENAEGIARMIEKILADQGTPNGYIVGREASGAFFVGARYGSGTLYHKVEGQRPVYWTGPSIGFDVGANGGKTFVLVYNLFDTEDLYERFPAGEGQAYFIGGLTASYLRRGDTVLIPIRMGAGLRLGINAGYMKFSKEHRWFPF